MCETKLLQITARRGFSCPQVPTSPRGSALVLPTTRTQMLRAQGTRAFPGPQAQLRSTGLSVSFISSFVCDRVFTTLLCHHQSHQVSTCVSHQHMGQDPSHNQMKNFFCYMRTSGPGSVPKHAHALAMWPESVFNCVMCVTIDPTSEPTDRVRQLGTTCQIPSDQGIVQAFRWWKWSIKWQIGGVLWNRSVFYKGPLASKRKEELLPNNVTATGTRSCSWKSLTFRKEKSHFSHSAAKSKERETEKLSNA